METAKFDKFDKLLSEFEAAKAGQPDDLNEFSRLLEEFARLPITRRRPKTLLEVTGFPHAEAAYSNLLKFLLDPKEEHGMGDLVLRSLLEAAQFHDLLSHLTSARKLEVTREDVTEENKRIDILVNCEGFVLGIENKVLSRPNNPFDEYWQRLKSIAKDTGKTVKGILLSLRNEEPPPGSHEFRLVTYDQLFAALRKNIGASLFDATPKHLFYLMDFIKTLENLKLQKTMDEKFAEFWAQHEEIARQFHGKTEELLKDMKSRCRRINDVTPPKGIEGPDFEDSSENRPGFYFCTWCEAALGDGVTLGLEAGLRAKGWQIILYGWHEERAEDADNIKKANDKALEFIRVANIQILKRTCHRWERGFLHEQDVPLDGKALAGHSDVWTYAEYEYRESEETVQGRFEELLELVAAALRDWNAGIRK